MLSRIERCSNEGSWVTTEICARRLSCVTAAMSWPSIRMRPSSRSKKRSSKLTRVDLPAPERPARPLLSPARPRGKAQPVDQPALPAVAEAPLLELDFAARDRERRRARLVGERDRPRD